MKYLSWLALMAVALAATNPARADTSDAILRCDPAVLIYKIDGKSDTYGAQSGHYFVDCNIPLNAGTHALEVCYDASSMSMNATQTIQCDKPRNVSFDAVAGRTYRLRFSIGQSWKAWVDDVTDAEAAYSYAKPPKKPKPENKAERKTTLVLQISPANAIPHFFGGELLGPWFVPGREAKAENTGIAKAAPDGFVVLTVDAGDNLAVTNVRILEGSVFMPKIFLSCGDYQARVFDEVAGGKVLYLGHMTLAGNDYEQKVSWSDDIDAARKYVDVHFPKLAGKLEPTSNIPRRIPELCVKYPQILTNAP